MLNSDNLHLAVNIKSIKREDKLDLLWLFFKFEKKIQYSE